MKLSAGDRFYLRLTIHSLVTLTSWVYCAIPSFSNERISNFVSLTDGTGHNQGCRIGSFRTAPSEALLETELYQWLLSCKIKIDSAAKNFSMPDTSASATFSIDLDDKTGSAFLKLKQSSGRKSFDITAENVIKSGTPFNRPFNSLPYKRGLLVEIKQSAAYVRLAPKQFTKAPSTVPDKINHPTTQ